MPSRPRPCGVQSVLQRIDAVKGVEKKLFPVSTIFDMVHAAQNQLWARVVCTAVLQESHYSAEAISGIIMSTKLTTIEIDMNKLEEALRRMETNEFRAEDCETIRAVGKAYIHLLELLKDKNASISRLRKMLFGASTEKTKTVLGRDSKSSAAEGASAVSEDAKKAGKTPPKGHGRNGADAYRGAEKIKISHETLAAGDSCPHCGKGTVYDTTRPGVLVRLVGQAPIQAKIYELQKLRCNLCGEMFKAQSPEGVGTEKYDATAGSMIGLLKYGTGMPFNREEKLQASVGIPLPASTQWEIVRDKAKKIEPAFEELVHQAAQGEVLYNDDTTVKILEMMGKRAKQQAGTMRSMVVEDAANNSDPDRKGLYTSGIVSTKEGRKIALFLSGRKHAGENLADVLARRSKDLSAPIQMCDPLSRNMPAELATIVANCLAHGRRKFVEVEERFPDECRRVLESLEVVYKNDALAKEQKLSPEERLAFHQAQSGAVMEELHAWFVRQFDEHRVEPNSSLGAVISYMLKHWEKFTLFLRVPGAPLDNNICEQALKRAILHRKNALFYKTRRGAHVGDVFMSLIHTCQFCGANAFDYLTELERHAGELSANPQNWMPWNYKQTLGNTGPPPNAAP
jgi:transposase